MGYLRVDPHLYARRLGVVERPVGEQLRVKLPAEPAIQQLQKVLVEPSRDTRCVIVRCLKNARVLGEVHPDEEVVPFPQSGP